jgi:hypothetical protein
VDNGILKIYTRNNLMATKPMKARISFKSISALKVSGGDDVTSETPVNVEALDVLISSGSDIHVSASKEITGYISGGGDVYYSGNPEKISVDARGGSEVHKE